MKTVKLEITFSDSTFDDEIYGYIQEIKSFAGVIALEKDGKLVD